MVDLIWKGSTAVAVGRMVRQGVRGSGEVTTLTERLLPFKCSVGFRKWLDGDRTVENS
jgi:hypothetical protein